MKRYLSIWLGLSAALLLLVAAFNAVVDPYGWLRLLDQPGFNRIKPAAANRAAMGKAYQLLRLQPGTLILGNSRAEVGLDPQHPAWPAPARPVYNAALPGTGTATSLRYLQHALAATAGNPQARPGVVLWGIDFMDFLTDAPADHEDDRLLGQHTSGFARWQQTGRDYLASTVTLSALFDSVQTLALQRNPYATDLTAQGFNPMRDYLKISADEGYWNVFRQRDQANIKAYVQRPKDVFDASGKTSHAWEDLDAVIRLCRQNGIQLQLFTYPYHAHLLEIIRLTGHWSALETWKRGVVQRLADEARLAHGPAFVFWDFADFNAMTTEAIPARGDRTTRMRWYWEAGHFKSALGNLMLAQMLDPGAQPAGPGVRLTPANVDEQLSRVQAHGADYRNTHPQDMAELHRLLARQSAPLAQGRL